jgi:hypothetical protein
MFSGSGFSGWGFSDLFARKTNLGNVIGQRKNSPRESWIGSYFFTVRANKFAQWKTGFSVWCLHIFQKSSLPRNQYLGKLVSVAMVQRRTCEMQQAETADTALERNSVAAEDIVIPGR